MHIIWYESHGGYAMRHHTIRLKNRLLQAMYRPKTSSVLPARTLDWVRELDQVIEEKVTPLLGDIF